MSGLAEEDVVKKAWVVWARRGAGAVMFLAVGVGVVLVARALSSPIGPQQRQMAKIRIVPDTPPPPPPPKEEKRPEPKDRKELKVDQPKQQPMQAQPLKMEGDASDKGMAGVAGGTVDNEYNGQKIGDDGVLNWFKTVLQRYVQAALQNDAKLRKDDYRVVIRLWLAPDGAVSRAELVSSTGNSDTDERLRAGLATLPPLAERPPEGLPQPVTMRVTSRS
jgi:protein TonB